MDYYLGVYQERTILLYFISSNADGMFYIFVQEENAELRGMCAAEPARLAVEYNRVWPLKQERELEKFKRD